MNNINMKGYKNETNIFRFTMRLRTGCDTGGYDGLWGTGMITALVIGALVTLLVLVFRL